jgi:CRISPR system Cascade subunit CasE
VILSRLFLNPPCREVRRDLADCQEMHRTIMAAFPHVQPDSARSTLAILFRVEQSRAIGLPVLLIQSLIEPQWNHLPPNYLATDAVAINPDSKDLSAAWELVAAGTVLKFRLRANPTRKIDTKTGSDGVKRNGKRVELRTEDEQIAWLRRKAATGGFEIVSVQASVGVPDIRVTNEAEVRGLRSREQEKKPLTFASVLFEGKLRVTDKEKFRWTLGSGIGTAKAYGFGLLSIAPAT